MTPLDTCIAIERYLSDRLGDMRLPTPTGEESAIRFFRMALPQPEMQEMLPREEDADGNEIERGSDDDDVPINGEGYSRREAREIFPCVVIRPIKCSCGDLTDQLIVVLTVGVFDESNRCMEGLEWLVNVLERIRQLLEAQPVLEKRYELEGPVTWEVFDESLHPFWFGEMVTEWNLYRPVCNVPLDDDYRGGNYPTGKGPYPGQPKKSE